MSLREFHSGVRHLDYSELLPDNGDQIDTTTIDTFLDGNRTTECDVIKVDVVGFEERVLDGTGKLLQEPGNRA